MMCKEHKNINLGFISEKFSEGKHMCFIYNSEEERKRVISRFLEEGVKGQEQVSYFAHDMSKDSHRLIHHTSQHDHHPAKYR